LPSEISQGAFLFTGVNLVIFEIGQLLSQRESGGNSLPGDEFSAGKFSHRECLAKRVGGGDKEKKWLKRAFLPRAGVLQLAQ
jgi:hypothetical protein